MRDDVTVRRIFNWTQNPTLARDIAARKMAVYDELMEGRQPAEMLEARPFLETLEKCVRVVVRVWLCVPLFVPAARHNHSCAPATAAMLA